VTTDSAEASKILFKVSQIVKKKSVVPPSTLAEENKIYSKVTQFN
jgi:hypothetical protein